MELPEPPLLPSSTQESSNSSSSSSLHNEMMRIVGYPQVEVVVERRRRPQPRRSIAYEPRGERWSSCSSSSGSIDYYPSYYHARIRKLVGVCVGIVISSAVTLQFVYYYSNHVQQEHRRHLLQESQHPMSSSSLQSRRTQQRRRRPRTDVVGPAAGSSTSHQQRRRQLRASAAAAAATPTLGLEEEEDVVVQQSSSLSETTHPVFSPPPLHHLRYLAFGSSNTWGIGLQNFTGVVVVHEDDENDFTTATTQSSTTAAASSLSALQEQQQQQLPYPYLLDADAVSVALPTGSHYADLAAACTQTLVDGIPQHSPSQSQQLSSTTTEDNNASSSSSSSWIPDVITVEYTTEITPSHVLLLKRLRRRYPSTVVVLVQLFQPATQWKIGHVSSNTSTTQTATMTSLQDWWLLQQQQSQEQRDTSQRDTDTALVEQDTDNDFKAAAQQLAQAMVAATVDGSMQWSTTTTTATTTATVQQLLLSDHLLLHYDALSRYHDDDLSFWTNTTQLANYLQLYTTTTADVVMNLSPVGHQRVAHDVQALVEESFLSSHRITESTVRSPPPPIPQLKESMDRITHDDATWGSGDHCSIWYATGNYQWASTGRPVNLPQHPSSSGGVVSSAGENVGGTTTASSRLLDNLAQHHQPHKHSLDFVRFPSKWSIGEMIPFRRTRSSARSSLSSNQSSSDANVNSITVHNPFPTERLLSLTYLTDADGMSYPRTRVVLNGVPSVVIHPVHDREIADEPTSSTTGSPSPSGSLPHTEHHVTRTTGVGYIPPGTSTVRLDPLQSTHLPFRLLGASILAEEVQDLTSIEFSLQTTG